MLTKPQIKYIQSLNQKKFRQENNEFVAEGPKIINELLSSAYIEPVALYATEEWWVQHQPLRNRLPAVAHYEITKADLERISFLSTPHQVLGIFRKPVFSSPVSLHNSITLLLDNIQDPGNFGTIVRIADWFGLQQIIASADSVDAFNPKVVQASMGSISRVMIRYEELLPFIAAHRSVPVYASTLQGKPVSFFGKIKEGMLLIGNESKGLGADLIASASHQLTIPGTGRAESLNAAVATGILLSHLV